MRISSAIVAGRVSPESNGFITRSLKGASIGISLKANLPPVCPVNKRKFGGVVRGVKIEAKKHQFVLAKKYQKSMSVGVDFGLCLALSFVHSTQENLSSLNSLLGVITYLSLSG